MRPAKPNMQQPVVGPAPTTTSSAAPAYAAELSVVPTTSMPPLNASSNGITYFTTTDGICNFSTNSTYFPPVAYFTPANIGMTAVGADTSSTSYSTSPVGAGTNTAPHRSAIATSNDRDSTNMSTAPELPSFPIRVNPNTHSSSQVLLYPHVNYKTNNSFSYNPITTHTYGSSRKISNQSRTESSGSKSGKITAVQCSNEAESSVNTEARNSKLYDISVMSVSSRGSDAPEQLKTMSLMNGEITRAAAEAQAPPPRIFSWKDEKEHLQVISELAQKLQRTVQQEFRDCEDMSNSLEQANTAYNEINEAEHDVQLLLSEFGSSLQKTDETYKLYTAESISNCSSSGLDEVLDKLSEGLQIATVAMYRQPGDQPISKAKKSPLAPIAKAIKPVESFRNIPTKQVSPTTGSSESICTQLIDRLQELRERQTANIEALRYQQLNLLEVLNKVATKKQSYKKSVESLQKAEIELTGKQKLVDNLCGEGDYTDMSTEDLQDLCRQINKASRKIVTEVAVRELRAANKSPGLSMSVVPEKEICLVCFERQWNTTLSPCGHLLCNECSSRLNFCPQCRTRITGRQRCFQP